MSSVSLFSYVTVYLCFVTYVLCDTKENICANADPSNKFAPFTEEIQRIVRESDPLHLPVLQDNLPTISYKLTDVDFLGMKDCLVKNLTINTESLVFLLRIECPRIFLLSDYEVKGELLEFKIEGNGKLMVNATDYIFIFDGKYEKKLGEDNKLHAKITDYKIDVDARSNVAFNMTNLFNGNEKKGQEVLNFLNKNWKATDTLLHDKTVNGFMKIFVDNINSFLKNALVEDLSCKF